MKALFLILFCLISSNSFSQDRVLLVTSFQRPKERKLSFNKKRQDLYYGLETNFKRELGAGFLLDVLHDVDAYKLFQLVRAGTYTGIFWVSHAAEGIAFSESFASDNVILDKDGLNVKDIFHHLHPDTGFLALIGCFSQSFVEELVAARPELKNRIHGHSNKVDILQGLKLSMKVFNETYHKAYNPPQVLQREQKKIDLRITRTANESRLPPLFVYNRKKLLRVLPTMKEYTRSSYKLQIDPGSQVEDFKLIISTQKYFDQVDNSHDFGELDISIPGRKYGRYTLLKLNDKPIGVKSRIFKYSEEVPVKATPAKSTPVKKPTTKKKSTKAKAKANKR